MALGLFIRLCLYLSLSLPGALGTPPDPEGLLSALSTGDVRGEVATAQILLHHLSG